MLLLLLLFSDPFHVDDVDRISVALPNLCRDKASHQHAWLQPHYYPLLQWTCTMLCPTRQGRDDHEEAVIIVDLSLMAATICYMLAQHAFDA